MREQCTSQEVAMSIMEVAQAHAKARGVSGGMAIAAYVGFLANDEMTVFKEDGKVFWALTEKGKKAGRPLHLISD